MMKKRRLQALGVIGFSAQSDATTMDKLIVSKNLAIINRYLKNNKNEELESEIGALGLSTTKPKYLERLITEIKIGKKAADKKKRDKRIKQSSIKSYAEDLNFGELEEEFEDEFDFPYNEAVATAALV
jgi:hypothetical protein